MPIKGRGEMVELNGKEGFRSIPHKILEEAYRAGAAKEGERAGTFFHIDQSTVYASVNDLFKGKIELRI
jgi:hypothetical protein